MQIFCTFSVKINIYKSSLSTTISAYQIYSEITLKHGQLDVTTTHLPAQGEQASDIKKCRGDYPRGISNNTSTNVIF